MARFGQEPGERGSLDPRVQDDGSTLGFFVPKVVPENNTKAARLLETGVKLLEMIPSDGRLVIHPIDTRPWSDGFLGSKYEKITTIVLNVDVEIDSDLIDILECLPSGFTRDYEYGLGLARECEVFIRFIEETTDCSCIEFVPGGEPIVEGQTFRIGFPRFDSIRAELSRIKSRGDGGIRRVKETYVHNDLGPILGLERRKLSLGRHSTSRWMTGVAAGETPLNEDEQVALVDAMTASSRQIATQKPANIARLQQDLELVSLEVLISRYSDALEAGHQENWWQDFFEHNVFALQLLFGGPTVFVDAQVPIGEGGNSVKGKKIADYMLKNPMTNNASLVEIKKPSTKLMKKRPYREGVYGVQAEIGEAVTQVLDQALQLTRYEVDTKSRMKDSSWMSNAPRCFVVAGLINELDTDDKLKSFELYREHLSGVRLVTYDEILEQLKTLRLFLASESLE